MIRRLAWWWRTRKCRRGGHDWLDPHDVYEIVRRRRVLIGRTRTCGRCAHVEILSVPNRESRRAMRRRSGLA
jgi:hypothetical protein